MVEKLYEIKLAKPARNNRKPVGKLHKMPAGAYEKDKPQGPEPGALFCTLDKFGRKIAMYETYVAYEIEKSAGAFQGFWLRMDKRDWWLVEELHQRGRTIRLVPSEIHSRIGLYDKKTKPLYLDEKILASYGRKKKKGETIGYVNHSFYDLRLENLEIRSEAEYLDECVRAYNAEISESAKRAKRIRGRKSLENREESFHILAWASELGEAMQAALGKTGSAVPPPEPVPAKAKPEVIKPLQPATEPDKPSAPTTAPAYVPPELPSALASARGNALSPEHRSYMDERPGRGEDNSQYRNRPRAKSMGGEA